MLTYRGLIVHWLAKTLTRSLVMTVFCICYRIGALALIISTWTNQVVYRAMKRKDKRQEE